MNIEIFLGVGMFTTVIVALVAFILAARSKLVASGDVNIEINGEKTITVAAGDKLLQTLSNAGLFLPSACGGGGTCAQCKCIVPKAVALCCQLKSRTLTGAKPTKAGDFPVRQR